MSIKWKKTLFSITWKSHLATVFLSLVSSNVFICYSRHLLAFPQMYTQQKTFRLLLEQPTHFHFDFNIFLFFSLLFLNLVPFFLFSHNHVQMAKIKYELKCDFSWNNISSRAAATSKSFIVSWKQIKSEEKFLICGRILRFLDYENWYNSGLLGKISSWLSVNKELWQLSFVNFLS